ncbi:hypothetical protein ACLBSN_32990, partial [Klebsiella pneumoniae]
RVISTSRDRQVEAAQVGHRQVGQGAGLEDHEVVRLEIVPLHLAQALELDLAILPGVTGR